MQDRVEIRTPRKGARIGDRIIVGGQPVMEVKSGHKRDFVTVNEFAEVMLGKPIDRIIFKEDK